MKHLPGASAIEKVEMRSGTKRPQRVNDDQQGAGRPEVGESFR